jgi:Na+-translocating ferredoxin:NAD+ oxidoreductase RnfC subunit
MRQRTSIIEAVEAAGVVGCGGAGYPSAVKLGGKAEILIVNAAECEPLLYSDYWAMVRRPELLIRGAELAAEALNARKVVIGIKEKRGDLLDLYRAKADGRFEVRALRDVYPAGDEHMLTHEVTGRVPPHGGLPLHVGVVVHNVITLQQIAEAVDGGKPVTCRYVTIACAVADPLVAEAPIGTPVSHLIELAGGATIPEFAILEGGAMMGRRVAPDEPVKKTSSGFILLPPDNPALADASLDIHKIALIARSVCDQCYYCTEMCPRRILGHAIEPHKIMRQIAFELETGKEATSFAHFCCECGACSLYACPQFISPRRVIRWLKERTSPPSKEETERFRPSPVINENTKIPTPRLEARLGLTPFKVKARFHEESLRPAELVLPLDQHFGAPSEPLVRAGQRVAAGELIARRKPDALGANLHAPLAGEITSVEDSIRIQTSA